MIVSSSLHATRVARGATALLLSICISPDFHGGQTLARTRTSYRLCVLCALPIEKDTIQLCSEDRFDEAHLDFLMAQSIALW